MLNFEHIFPYPFKSKAVFAMQEPNVKQEYRIAALVHSKLVADIVYRETLLLGWNISIEVTSYETALEDARRLFEEGYEVLLCHGGFREAVFKKFGRRTVFVERSEIDIIKGLSRARKLSDTVALTAHINEARDIEFMESLLGMRIIPVRYDTKEELEERIKETMARGVRVFVGGGGTARIVSRLGGQIFLDEPQPVNIRNAVSRAITIAENMRMEQTNRSNIQAMLHYSKEGVICLSAQRDIVFHNAQALKLLRVGASHELARFFPPLFLDEVLEHSSPFIDRVVTINGRQLLINTFPLAMSSSTTGAVCFIHDVQNLQKINRKIDTDLHSRGLVANYTARDIIGKSASVVKLKENIARYAPTDISVYIHGETGTGKELVAHALHAASKRAKQPFVVVNCAALPDPLLESELFGYEEGAFTGAKRGGKAGLFELANGGTLFFDEIGDMSHAVQLRLLRVLDAKEVMHVGGDRFIPVNVRVICASHKQLLDLVKTGSFRLDLYFRLAGVCLEVAPLRDRLEDVPLLIANVLKRYGKNASVVTPAILDAIRRYSWPGNIRELMSVMESYLVLLGDNSSSLACFEEIFRHRNQFFDKAPQEGTLGEQLAAYRLEIVRKEMRRCAGDRRKAARALGISYSSLRRVLEADAAKDVSVQD